MLSRYSLPVVTSVVTLSVLGAALYYMRRKKKQYVEVARVKKLFFHPVKSLKGFEVNELTCGSLGVEYKGLLERIFMLVNDEGVLVSLRQEPSLMLLSPTIVGEELKITGSGDEDLIIPLKHTVSSKDKIIKCDVHRDLIEGIDCGDKVAHWFQKYLKRTDVRLVRHSPDVCKRECKNSDPTNRKLAKEFPIAFQDAAPLHLLSESSVNHLNDRLKEEKISVLNFRPNVFVDGCLALSEDDWKYVKFSSGTEAVHMLPCGRCILTTVNPETGIKTGKEPLVTLRKFRMPQDKDILRRMGMSPAFGVLLGVRKQGLIRVNDIVYAVVEKGSYKFVEK